MDEPKVLKVWWGLVQIKNLLNCTIILVWDSVLEEEPHFQILSNILAWFTVQVFIATYVMLFQCKFDAPFDHFLWQGHWHGKYKLVQFYWMLLLSLSSSLLINTVCQQKGPLAKHENCKFPKPFQGCLGMLIGLPSAQKFWPRPHRTARTADFKCYFWLF